MAANSRFKRGTVRCQDCGRLTRDTGLGEGDLQMCADCIQAQEWANGITDGVYTLEDVPEEFRDKVQKYL